MQNNMEQGRNRVFINPYFKKGVNNSDPETQVPLMHVNPNFYQHMPNMQPVSKGKIYINPKFAGLNRISNEVLNVHRHYESHRPSLLVDGSTIFGPEASSRTRHESGSSTTTPTKSSFIQPIQAKSRYSLVRNKKTEVPQTAMKKTTVTNLKSNTVKINKYKSIRITEMKKNIDSVKPAITSISSITVVDNSSCPIQTMTINSPYKGPKTHKNRYKFVKYSQSVRNKPHTPKQVPISARKVMSSRTRLKTVGVFRINNIPCPQYRKYGKCLRKLQGKCEFLHDQKHVSICRKFLTGVCHDTKCLLSHELSDKKMPTCYFYLKGMCTKDGCPYLHVKLNEKAKICSDFTRGYCEKGDKCLNRHMTKSPLIDSKRRLSRQHKLTSQISSKYAIEKSRLKHNTESAQKRKRKIKLHKQSSVQDNKDLCGRYYKESAEEPSGSESFEVIKPSRCKLGTLPSFIQL